ncbi:MAG: hypothetical protein Q9216_001830 [Gyalolechia sp. 2 TL-2023]
MDQWSVSILLLNGSFKYRQKKEKNKSDMKYMIVDDGLCIFDITLARDDFTEEVSAYDFRRAANALIGTCGNGRDDPEGGIATGLGRHGRLSLTMTSYRPQVRCFQPIQDPPAECVDIVESMPATKDLQVFGTDGDQGVQIDLPREIANGPSVTSWYRIWEEMVAVEGMCARQALDGQAFAIETGRGFFRPPLSSRPPSLT